MNAWRKKNCAIPAAICCSGITIWTWHWKILKAVTANPSAVDLNTGLYAWLRTGQIYDLKKKREEAKRAYLQTVVIAPTSDAASAAQNYLLSRYKR